MIRHASAQLLVAVAILGCAAVLPAPQALLPQLGAHPELPPLPASVTSQLGPVPVEIVDSIAGAQPGTILLGAFNVRTRKIFVRRDLESRLTAWQTLHHERCHVTLFDAGIRISDPAAENLICDTFAAAALRDQLEQLTRRRR